MIFELIATLHSNIVFKMKMIIRKIDNILRKIKHPYLVQCEPTLTLDDMVHLFEFNNLILNEDIVELFSWKGGLNGASIYDDNYIELCSYGCLIDLRSAFSLYALDRCTSQELDGKLPIIQSDSGDMIAIELGENNTNRGKLFVMSPSITLSSDFVSIYDSLTSFLLSIGECYKQDVYQLQGNRLKVDYHKEAIISKKYNPLSSFWQDGLQ